MIVRCTVFGIAEDAFNKDQVPTLPTVHFFKPFLEVFTISRSKVTVLYF